MRIFVTGATGFIGSGVVPELLGAGHSVVGLARSDASAQALTDLGVEVHRGSLDDPADLARVAAEAEGVIHLAFKHDFENFIANAETDRVVVEALGAALEGSGKPFITTSGTLMVAFTAPGQLGDETFAPPAGGPRVASEMATIGFGSHGVRSSVIRLPPIVHADGTGGFLPPLIAIARGKGVAAYVGDGQNRWPAAHRSGVATLYRLALEKGPGGKRYHAVQDEGVTTRRIAEAIGAGLNVPVMSIAPEQVDEHFGFLSRFIALDAPASSKLTREELGWTPTGPTLLEDIDTGTFFETA